MQYKIPQNVQIEDKIVGPLTLKQLAVLGLGGGFTYLLYLTLAKKYYIEVWLPPTAISGLLTLAFTFLKLNGIPFGKWLFLLIEYRSHPRKRTFVQGAGDHFEATLFAEKKESKKKNKSDDEELDRYQKLQKISELSKLLDTHETPKI